MKINKKTPPKTTLIAIIVASIVLVGGGIVYAYTQQNPSTPKNLSEIQEDSVPEPVGDDTPSNLPSKDGDTQGVTTDEGTLVEGDIESPNLTRAQSRGNNIIRVIGTLQSQSSGYCRVSLTSSDGVIINDRAQINIGPNYYSCSLDVSDQRISAGTTWTVTIDHIIDNMFAPSNSRTVSVQE